jgi:hypothetical protein
VGYAKLQGEDLNYLGIAGLRIAGGQGVAIIAFCQILLMFGCVGGRRGGAMEGSWGTDSWRGSAAKAEGQ